MQTDNDRWLIKRAGIPTSSNASRLCTFATDKKSKGKPFFTYVEEKKNEVRSGRGIGNEFFSRPTSWGSLLELYVHERKLSDEFILINKTFLLSECGEFGGTPDLLKLNVVGELKCPFSLIGFFELEKCISEGMDFFKKKKPKYYWQIVQNSILTDCTKGEILDFCPKESELDHIRQFADEFICDNPYEYKWIVDAQNNALPHLKDDSKVEGFQRLEFDIDQNDVDFLMTRTKEAYKLIHE